MTREEINKQVSELVSGYDMEPEDAIALYEIGKLAALRAETPAPADLVSLVQEWQVSSRDLDDRVSREELPEHDQASENALHAAHRRHEAAIRKLVAWTPVPVDTPASEWPKFTPQQLSAAVADFACDDYDMPPELHHKFMEVARHIAPLAAPVDTPPRVTQAVTLLREVRLAFDHTHAGRFMCHELEKVRQAIELLTATPAPPRATPDNSTGEWHATVLGAVGCGSAGGSCTSLPATAVMGTATTTSGPGPHDGSHWDRPAPPQPAGEMPALRLDDVVSDGGDAWHIFDADDLADWQARSDEIVALYRTPLWRRDRDPQEGR